MWCWLSGIGLAMVMHTLCGYPSHMSRLVRGLSTGLTTDASLKLNLDLCPGLSWAAAMSPIGLSKGLVDVGCLPMWLLLALQLWREPYLKGVLVGPMATYMAVVMPVRYVHYFLPLDPSG